jgi:hypothetical protein
MNRSFGVVFFLLLLVGCATENPQDQAMGEKLLAVTRDITCQQQALAVKTDSLWDGVSNRLSIVLPKDMPKSDRDNMIKLRNTDLIKMFKVYPGLDSLSKMKVEEAGKIDEQIVANLHALRQEMEANDQAIFAFLGSLEKKSSKSFKKWSKAFDDAKHHPCTE